MRVVVNSRRQKGRWHVLAIRLLCTDARDRWHPSAADFNCSIRLIAPQVGIARKPLRSAFRSTIDDRRIDERSTSFVRENLVARHRIFFPLIEAGRPATETHVPVRVQSYRRKVLPVRSSRRAFHLKIPVADRRVFSSCDKTFFSLCEFPVPRRKLAYLSRELARRSRELRHSWALPPIP
jgi:hypothetical protein